MRWTLRISFVLFLAWLIFLASPFVALYDLAKAVDARDLARISDRVNFNALRVSLSRQILGAFVWWRADLGDLDRQFAIGAGAAILNPVVEEARHAGGPRRSPGGRLAAAGHRRRQRSSLSPAPRSRHPSAGMADLHRVGIARLPQHHHPPARNGAEGEAVQGNPAPQGRHLASYRHRTAAALRDELIKRLLRGRLGRKKEILKPAANRPCGELPQVMEKPARGCSGRFLYKSSGNRQRADS